MDRSQVQRLRVGWVKGRSVYEERLKSIELSRA